LKKKKKVILGLEEDGCNMPIELEVKEKREQVKESLSKRNIKNAASIMYGLTVASEEFQKRSNWKRNEKDLNSNRTTGERREELRKLEDLYSFKTMIRVLYQAGIIILREAAERVEIPMVSFPKLWYEFAGLVKEENEEEPEGAVLIAVVECFILFEEYIKTRRMLVTSRLKPTRATNPSPEGGT
jgi:hypothetical protein